MTVSEAARATNVRENYLEALENDEPLDTFPAPVYARFFLQEYARFLGLNEGPLLEALESRPGADEPVLKVSPPVVPPRKRWGGGMLVAIAAVGIVVLAVNSFRPHHAARTGTLPRPPSAAAPTIVPATKLPVKAARRNGIDAVLSFSARCWLRATVDGKVVVERTFVPGRQLRLRAQRTLQLVMGNAGGVDLRINGRRVSTGGRVVTLSFVWRNGHVVAA